MSSAAAANPAASAPSLTLHHVAIFLIVMLEYLQTVMVSFAAHDISRGIGALPEQFSLAAACYAACAVVTILAHRWLVQRLGYRSLLRWSLLLFAVGAVVCTLAGDVPAFIAGRIIQALGGAAFFTASRVQIMHYQGPARLRALLALPFGIMSGAGIAPILASLLLVFADWRALFWVMLPLVWLTDRVVCRAVPEHEPCENERPDNLHPWGILLLSGGIFLLQFVLERARFVFFSDGLHLWALGAGAVLLLLGYLHHDWRREAPLIPYRSFLSERYVWGMTAYGFGYLVVSACTYVLPVYMLQGLGWSLHQTGWLMGLTGLLAMPVAVLHLRMTVRWPHVRRFLLAGMLMLAAFAMLMRGSAGQPGLWQVVLALLLLNALFMPFLLGTAAFGTFRGVEERVFTPAYQVKNAMREIANALGLAWASIILQERTASHYTALSASGPDPIAAAGGWSQQAIVLAGQDFFSGLAVVALLAAVVVFCQRRFV